MTKLADLPPLRGALVHPGETRSELERGIAICARIAEGGVSLRNAANIEGLDHSRFLQQVAKNEELRIMYETARAHAREELVDSLNHEAASVMKTALQRGHDASSYVAAFVAKVNYIKWEAERREPKKYGNRLDVNHSGSIDLATRLAHARVRAPLVDVVDVDGDDVIDQ